MTTDTSKKPTAFPMDVKGATFPSSNVPGFLSKLWLLVEEKSTNELIRWSPVSVMQMNGFLELIFRRPLDITCAVNLQLYKDSVNWKNWILAEHKEQLLQVFRVCTGSVALGLLENCIKGCSLKFFESCFVLTKPKQVFAFQTEICNSCLRCLEKKQRVILLCTC